MTPLVRALEDCGVSTVATLPDSWLAPSIDALAAAGVRVVRVACEDDAIGVCAGLWLGGERGGAARERGVAAVGQRGGRPCAPSPDPGDDRGCGAVAGSRTASTTTCTRTARRCRCSTRSVFRGRGSTCHRASRSSVGDASGGAAAAAGRVARHRWRLGRRGAVVKCGSWPVRSPPRSRARTSWSSRASGRRACGVVGGRVNPTFYGSDPMGLAASTALGLAIAKAAYSCAVPRGRRRPDDERDRLFRDSWCHRCRSASWRSRTTATRPVVANPSPGTCGMHLVALARPPRGCAPVHRAARLDRRPARRSSPNPAWRWPWSRWNPRRRRTAGPARCRAPRTGSGFRDELADHDARREART